MRDILLLLKEAPSLKTNIMTGANLSFTLLKKYMSRMMHYKLIERRCKGSQYFKIAKRGNSYLGAYDRCEIFRYG